VLIYQAEKIRVPKAAVAINPGQAVYWSGTYGDGVTNVWASGLYWIGNCVKVAAAGDDDVLIHLEGHKAAQESAP
jgi:predicted RecA/RadA family phage recombinase